MTASPSSPCPSPRAQSGIASRGFRRVGFRLIVLASVGLASWASLLPAVRANPVFGDEVGWISASSKEADLFLSGDFSWKSWNYREFGAYGAMNPPVGKLAIGLPLRLGASVPPFGKLWEWSLDEAGNEAAGNLPPRDLLLDARRLAAWHAALLAVVVCALGWEIGGLGVGLVAAALLCAHPVWRETGSRVMTDMLLNAVLVAMVFPAARWFRSPAGRMALGPPALLGVLAGVAGAIKPTGIVFGLLFLGAVAGLQAFRVRKARALVAGVGAAVLAAGASMVSLDPWLWPAPGKAAPGVVLEEVPVAVGLLRADDPLAAFEGSLERVPAIHALVRPLWIAVRARDWKNLVGFQKTLPSLQWRAPRLLELLDWMLWSFVSFPGELLLVLAGAWGMTRTPMGSAGGRSGIGALPLALLAFTGFAAGYVLLLVVLPVPRYLLPFFAIVQVPAAFGIVRTWRHARARLTKIAMAPRR